MIDAVRAEWIKFSTLVSSWVLVIIAIAFPLVIVLLTAALEDSVPDSDDLASVLTGTSVVSALLLGTLGVLTITSDYGHNTIRPTFAALPDRWRPLIAKTVVQVGVTAVVLAGVMVVGWVGAAVVAEGVQAIGDDGVLASLCGAVLLGIGLTILGYGLGLLLRNTALAICILLLWPLVAEGIVAGLFAAAGWDGLQRWLPYQAGFNLIAVDPSDDQLGRVGGGVWFFAWVLAIAAFGLWRAKRRDA